MIYFLSYYSCKKSNTECLRMMGDLKKMYHQMKAAQFKWTCIEWVTSICFAAASEPMEWTFFLYPLDTCSDSFFPYTLKVLTRSVLMDVVKEPPNWRHNTENTCTIWIFNRPILVPLPVLKWHLWEPTGQNSFSQFPKFSVYFLSNN